MSRPVSCRPALETIGADHLQGQVSQSFPAVKHVRAFEGAKGTVSPSATRHFATIDGFDIDDVRQELLSLPSSSDIGPRGNKSLGEKR